MMVEQYNIVLCVVPAVFCFYHVLLSTPLTLLLLDVFPHLFLIVSVSLPVF